MMTVDISSLRECCGYQVLRMTQCSVKCSQWCLILVLLALLSSIKKYEKYDSPFLIILKRRLSQMYDKNYWSLFTLIILTNLGLSSKRKLLDSSNDRLIGLISIPIIPT